MSKDLALQQSEQEKGMSALQLELHDFINFDKAKIKDTAAILQQSVTDGYTSEIDALIFSKKIATLAEELDTRIRPLASGKSYGKDYTRFGVKVTEAMQGVKYDFTTCEDPIYNRLAENFEAAKLSLDERKDLLKTVTKPTEMYDPETSEVFMCKPPVKSGKMGLTLTLRNMIPPKKEITEPLQFYFNASPQKQAEILYYALCFMEKHRDLTVSECIVEGAKSYMQKQ